MNTIYKDWFSKWAIYSPDQIAVEEVDTGRHFTYGQINQIANALTENFLRHNDLKKGDRVVILSEHCLEYVVLFSLAQKAGIILVPINFRLTSSEIDYLIKNCQPGMIICQDQFADKLEASKNYNGKFCTMESFSELCQNILANSEGSNPHIQSIDDDHPLFILYTSGTTGFPKGALYTHKMLFWNSVNTSISLEISASDKTVTCMPTFHTGGWNVLLTPFLHHGATVFILKKFDADIVLKCLMEQKIDLFMAVPTMLKLMAASSHFQNLELPDLRYIIVGGEALPLQVIEQWAFKNIKIRQGYGLTEVGPNLTSLHQDDALQKQGSIGKPNFYVETKLVDDNNNQVGADEIGEFCIRGNIVTPGYYQNKEATNKAIIDGWFHTGDLMKMDRDGFLFVVDRKKSMYISGGENVYPAEVERVIRQLEAIEEVAIIGVPDNKWGEVGRAFYVVKQGLQLNLEALQQHCVAYMAKFKVPKYFERLDSLPKNDSGKIDRNLLKMRSLESVQIRN